MIEQVYIKIAQQLISHSIKTKGGWFMISLPAAFHFPFFQRDLEDWDIYQDCFIIDLSCGVEV